MRKKVLESSILFVSIVKWLFLAACVGILVGISTAIFLKALDAGITFAKGVEFKPRPKSISGGISRLKRFKRK